MSEGRAMQVESLSFVALRTANRARLPLFRNKAGQQYHTSVDGAEWSLQQWLNAVGGEVGEACNLIKKIERGDFAGREEMARVMLSWELADAVIYLDIFALRLGQALEYEVPRQLRRHGNRTLCDRLIAAHDPMIGFAELRAIGDLHRLPRQEILGDGDVLADHGGHAFMRLGDLARYTCAFPKDASARDVMLKQAICLLLMALDDIAAVAGIDLGRAVREKFNKVSIEQGLDVLIPAPAVVVA